MGWVWVRLISWVLAWSPIHIGYDARSDVKNGARSHLCTWRCVAYCSACSVYRTVVKTGFARPNLLRFFVSRPVWMGPHEWDGLSSADILGSCSIRRHCHCLTSHSSFCWFLTYGPRKTWNLVTQSCLGFSNVVVSKPTCTICGKYRYLPLNPNSCMIWSPMEDWFCPDFFMCFCPFNSQFAQFERILLGITFFGLSGKYLQPGKKSELFWLNCRM